MMYLGLDQMIAMKYSFAEISEESLPKKHDTCFQFLHCHQEGSSFLPCLRFHVIVLSYVSQDIHYNGIAFIEC